MDEPAGRNEWDGAGAPPAAVPVTAAPRADEIDAFALALAGLAGVDALGTLLARESDGWLRREVFGPAARRLGDWWVSDEICFATVTLGMAELQRLAWTHGRAPPHPRPLRPPMLLAAMPGEQHTFGLNLLMEDLRAQGVEPALLPCPTREALLTAAASGCFKTIGLSAGSDDRLAEVAPLARALRAAAPGRLHLLLGGPVAEQLEPGVAGVDEILGADAALERLCALASQSVCHRAAAA